MINTSCLLQKAEVRQLMMVCRINFRGRKLFLLLSSLFHSFFAPLSLLAPSILALLPRDCFNFEKESKAIRPRKLMRHTIISCLTSAFCSRQLVFITINFPYKLSVEFPSLFHSLFAPFSLLVLSIPPRAV